MSLPTRALALGLAAVSLSAPIALAADHGDGSSAISDPTTDLGDLYAWMDSTGSILNLAMTVYPTADKTNSKFSNAALYVFHTMAKASFSDTGVYPEVNVTCSFNAAQTVQCWAGVGEYVTGNASGSSGLVSQSGKFRVFAGPRNDPFFFNLTAFNNTATMIRTALPTLSRDAAGCPTISAANQTTYKNSLSTPTADSFVGKNVLAVVVSLDKTLVTTAQRQVLTVYASTNKPIP